MRSTQDIGAVNEAAFHHHPNDAMVGTRFARLDISAEENIANERQKDRERGEGRIGLLGEHGCTSFADDRVFQFFRGQ
jgi:hypothetical protein